MDKQTHFESTQYGWLINLLFSGVILLMTLAYFLEWGDRPLPLVPFAVLTGLFLLILLLFYKLTIRVENSVIHLVYGIGLIHVKLTGQMVSVRIVNDPGHYGLGIRIIPNGMLYNIAGTSAVEIACDHAGKDIVRIGCRDCEGLLRAIKEQCT